MTTALARRRATLPERPTADRAMVEAALAQLEPEAAVSSGPDMDRFVMAALGWQVARTPPQLHSESLRTPGWRCRSPWQATWLPVPPVSRSLSAAADHVVPWRWSWGAGRRGGHPFGWVRLDDSTWFEASGTSPARCLLRAALFGQRWLLMQSEGVA